MKRKNTEDIFSKKRSFQNGLRELVALRRIGKKRNEHIVHLLSTNINLNLNFILNFPLLEVIPIPMKAADVKILLNHILKALSVLEECRIEHRDIKPHNIMYNSVTNNYILIDFDVVRLHSNEDIGYCSLTSPPECRDLLIRETYDGKADVFALGVTALLFLNMESYNLIDKISNNVSDLSYFYERKWIDNVPQELIEYLTPMLEYNPIHRKTAHQILNLERVEVTERVSDISELEPFGDLVNFSDFEPQVLQFTSYIYKMQKVRDNERFSYFLGSLEIAHTLTAKATNEDFFLNLYHSFIINPELFIKSEQALLNRRFVLMNIIQKSLNDL